MQSKCPVCGIKKSRIAKEQEANGLLSNQGFTYSSCGSFTKNKERIEKFMQTGNINLICKNELDEACFDHDKVMANQKIYQKEISQIKF